MSELKRKFGIVANEQPTGWWSFGACISHNEIETYLFINLFKWSVTIGWLLTEEEEHE